MKKRPQGGGRSQRLNKGERVQCLRGGPVNRSAGWLDGDGRRQWQPVFWNIIVHFPIVDKLSE